MGVIYDNKNDNLRSADTLEVILGVGEGPIWGLEDGLKSFYLGDTPLMNSTGVLNFKGAYLKIWPGYGTGEIIRPMLGGLASSTTVGVELKKNVPVVRRTTKTNLTFIDIRFVIQTLMENNDKGSYDGHFNFNIEWKHTASTVWFDAFNDHNLTITGKTTSTYVKEFRFAVEPGDDTYDIRVTKTNPSEEDIHSLCEVSWESFQEVYGAQKWEWPHTTIAHLNTKASNQLSNGIGFYGIYKGRVINVPSNFNPTQRTYIGIWDGTFKVDWTDDPAWILYDFITNDRYGLNAYDQVGADKWDFYEASKWCSTLVPNGLGGMQPRFSFNYTLAEASPGKEMARFIAGTFNASLFDSGDGVVKIRVDKPEDAIHLFTPENVVDGKFSYSFSDINTRYNDITVAFTNPDLNWETDRRRVFNQDSIDKFGRTPLDFVAVGALNFQDAIRSARYKLITGLTEKMTVTFKTNRLGAAVEPFQVILLGDNRLGFSFTGRIMATDPADKTVVYLRDPVYLEVGIDYQMNFQVPDPTSPSSYKIITIGIQEPTEAGLQKILFLDSDLPDDLPEFANFSLQQVNAGFGLPKPFRILSVKESDPDGDSYEITAIEVNRYKWEYIDDGTFIETPHYSYLDQKQTPQPSNFRVATEYEIQNAVNTPIVMLRWDRSNSNTIRHYRLEYARNGDAFSTLTEANDSEFKLVNPPAGLYDFRLYAVNIFNVDSPPLEIQSYQVVGETRSIAPPVNLRDAVTGTAVFNTADLRAVWEPGQVDPYFLKYRVEVRTSDDAVTYILRRTDYVTTPEYTYRFTTNAEDNGGQAVRYVALWVYHLDKNLNESAVTPVVFYNPPPPALGGNSFEGGFEAWHFDFVPQNSLPDFGGYFLYGSTVSGFTPSSANILYDGPDSTFSIRGSGRLYWRGACYDAFKTSLNLTPEYSHVAGGTIGTEAIENGAITTMAIFDVAGASASSGSATTSNTAFLGAFTTSTNGLGRVLLSLTSTSNNYIAQAYAKGNFSSNTVYTIQIYGVVNSVNHNVWAQTMSFNDAGGLVLTSMNSTPCVVKRDIIGVAQTCYYYLVVSAYRDDDAARTTGFVRSPLTLTIMEYLR